MKLILVKGNAKVVVDVDSMGFHSDLKFKDGMVVSRPNENTVRVELPIEGK